MIDYAPKRRRRWKRKLGVALCVVALLGWGGWRFGPDGYRRARLLTMQKLAVWQQPPEGTVVADTQSRLSTRNHAADEVDDSFNGTLFVSSPGANMEGSVACGNLAMAREARLVHATAAISTQGGLTVKYTVWSPAGIKSKSRLEGAGQRDFDLGRLKGLSSWSAQAATAHRLRLFAGHIIPGPHPQILFTYEIDGQQGTCGLRLYESDHTIESTADILPPP